MFGYRDLSMDKNGKNVVSVKIKHDETRNRIERNFIGYTARLKVMRVIQ